MLLAEIDGRAVGFSITLPDINEAIRPLERPADALSAFPRAASRSCGAAAHQDRADARARRAEEYRRRGIAEMLILRTLDYGKNVLGYTGAELSWTMEDNAPSTAPSRPSAPGATRPIASTKGSCRQGQ